MLKVDILSELATYSSRYSHPYIEKNYPESWVKDYRIGFLPKDIFDFGKYDVNILDEMGIYYKESNYSPLEGRVIIPIYDGDTLVGIAGRYPNKEVPKGIPKYYNTKFNKDKHFFTVPEPKIAKDQVDYFIGVEGYTDVWALKSIESLNAFPLGLMGLSFSDERIERINAMGKPFTFFLDGDDAGLNTMFLLSSKIKKLKVPFSVMISKGLDPYELVMFLGEEYLPEKIPYEQFYVEYMFNKKIEYDEIILNCVREGKVYVDALIEYVNKNTANM